MLSGFGKLEEQGIVFSEDKRALVECTNRAITEVIIPNGVTKIRDSVFEECPFKR